eukprot:4379300-Pleurochrysis_carterae.AAC.2
MVAQASRMPTGDFETSVGLAPDWGIGCLVRRDARGDASSIYGGANRLRSLGGGATPSLGRTSRTNSISAYSLPAANHFAAGNHYALVYAARPSRASTENTPLQEQETPARQRDGSSIALRLGGALRIALASDLLKFLAREQPTLPPPRRRRIIPRRRGRLTALRGRLTALRGRLTALRGRAAAAAVAAADEDASEASTAAVSGAAAVGAAAAAGASLVVASDPLPSSSVANDPRLPPSKPDLRA